MPRLSHVASAAAVFLLFCLYPALAQVGPPSPSEAVTEPDRLYETFFHQLVGAPESSAFVEVRLNGEERGRAYRPSAEERIGLTPEEGRLLRQSASECLDKLDTLNRASKAVRREAFFQRIESGRASRSVEAQMEEVRLERLRVIAETIEKVRTGFGPSQFDRLEAFIRSNSANTLFFPTIGPSGVPRPAR